MKLAEYCNSSSNYIGEIEIGRKFPSTEMIEKIATALKIEPYHLFRNQAEKADSAAAAYPRLPNAMKAEIEKQINLTISKILSKY